MQLKQAAAASDVADVRLASPQLHLRTVGAGSSRDACSFPKGSSGSLVAEAILREQGHELLIHSKSAAEEYRKATKEARVSLEAAGEAAALATCKALQANARIRESLSLLQLFVILALFAAAVCCHTLAVYKQQPRHELSPLAAAATCCCCLLGGGIDGQGLPVFKFLGHVLLLSSRCGGLLLFLVMSAKGVEGGAVDSKTNGVISVLTLSIAAATLSALLGASLSPDELNPSALYTTLWAFPMHITTGIAAGKY
ncbi:hypothetical protein ACSSS7_003989 [Eimeria intestinalis]